PGVPLAWLAQAVAGSATMEEVEACPGVFTLRHRHRRIFLTPLRHHEILQGFIAMVEAGRPPSAFDLECLLHAREAVTLKLLQYRAAMDARQRRRNDLIDILVS